MTAVHRHAAAELLVGISWLHYSEAGFAIILASLFRWERSFKVYYYPAVNKFATVIIHLIQYLLRGTVLL